MFTPFFFLRRVSVGVVLRQDTRCACRKALRHTLPSIAPCSHPFPSDPSFRVATFWVGCWCQTLLGSGRSRGSTFCSHVAKQEVKGTFSHIKRFASSWGRQGPKNQDFCMLKHSLDKSPVMFLQQVANRHVCHSLCLVDLGHPRKRSCVCTKYFSLGVRGSEGESWPLQLSHPHSRSVLLPFPVEDCYQDLSLGSLFVSLQYFHLLIQNLRYILRFVPDQAGGTNWNLSCVTGYGGVLRKSHSITG